LKSLHQALTGRTTSFKRTPKVSGHTSAPLSYLLLPYLLAFFLISGSAWSFAGGNALQGAASALNGALLVYAIGAFVGWRYSWTDVIGGIRLPSLASYGLRSPLTRGQRK
jgi:hypothetical protein